MQCGTRNSGASRFCLNCGQPLVRAEAPAAPTAATDQGQVPNGCPYCGESIQPAQGVDQLICLGCGASLRVRQGDGQARFEPLRS